MRAVQLELLPSELKVDASEAKRVGIRISLGTDGRLVTREVAPAHITATPPHIPGSRPTVIDDDAALHELEYVIVDVETTGGGWTRGHRITEVAAVRVRADGTVVDEFRTLVNPGRPIPSFITALTNITWDMVRDAPHFVDVAPHVARMLEGAVFVAHNATFDWNFVGAELDRAGLPLRGRMLCTVRMARRLVPEISSRSLDSLTHFFDIPVEARHRAWGDAAATAELFRRLMARLEEQEVTRWSELQALLKRRPKRRKRRANPHSIPEHVHE